ncbi:hypothetical protein B7486_17375 [cyanobacterium TDX16]|nr:hypothetical protein B7486_17375 [cyanobacterium TDX16]
MELQLARWLAPGNKPDRARTMLNRAITFTGFLMIAAGASCCLIRLQDKEWFGAYFLFREFTAGLVITVATLFYLRKSNESIVWASLIIGILWIFFGLYCWLLP